MTQDAARQTSRTARTAVNAMDGAPALARPQYGGSRGLIALVLSTACIDPAHCAASVPATGGALAAPRWPGANPLRGFTGSPLAGAVGTGAGPSGRIGSIGVLGSTGATGITGAAGTGAAGTGTTGAGAG